MDSLNKLSNESIKLLNKNRLLLPLVKAELVKYELSQIEIPKDQKNKLIADSKENLNLNKAEDFNQWMKLNDFSEEDVEHIFLSKVKIKKYCQQKLSHKIEAHFLKRKSELDIIIYSLIRVASPNLAKEIYLRIVGKEDEFGDLASTYSTGIERKSRGIMGPSTLGSIHPKLSKHLIESNPGEVKPPVEIEKNYIIVRVESYDPAQLDEFMRSKMGEELFANIIESKGSVYVKALTERNSSKDKQNLILGNS